MYIIKLKSLDLNTGQSFEGQVKKTLGMVDIYFQFTSKDISLCHLNNHGTEAGRKLLLLPLMDRHRFKHNRLVLLIEE